MKLIKQIFNKVKDMLNNLWKFIKKRKKLFLIIGIIIGIIILLTVVIMSLLFRSGELFAITKNPDGEKFKEEYEKLNDVPSEEGKTYPKVEISSNNIMKYTDIEEVLNIFKEHKNAVIYFGYSTCLYCRSAINVLLDVASTTDLDTIYYLDVSSEDSKYSELLNVLGEELIEDGDVYVPLVIFVVDGTVVSYNKGTLFSQDDPYIEMDEFQVKGLSEIYYYGINDVLGNPQKGT